jgi:ABC-type polar amino acid transport system ATPase subunit
MIEINGLTKRFRGHEVLRGANLTVEQGEVAVLLGPSGSGKSTLLRTINGLETFDEGTIRVHGINLPLEAGDNRDRALVKIRKRVGMVFQQFNLFPHLTAIQNIMVAPLHVLKRPAPEVRQTAAELLDRVGLADKSHLYPRSLSGGQQQRVAIARALAMQPEVILFDEPTSALDPRMTGEVVKVIQDLAHSGQTMLVVTHGIRFARSIATKVHVLSQGTIVESGSTETIFANPQHVQTQQLLNES